ncbi:MAG: LCP family protein [Anaerolineae bacterium]|nr:LCP family protein [Anaerolineae bacterium]
MTVPPPAPPRKRRPGCLLLLLGGLLALLVPVFLVGLFLVVYLLFPPVQMNVLLLGMDARAGEGYLTRTDSVIIMGVQPAGLDISLLSIPRDLFVDTPGYGLQRVNVVNVLGEQDQPGSGGRLAAAAVSGSFNIDVSRYVRLDFDSFTGIVDALGGIDIEVPALLIDYEYPTDDGGTTTVQFEAGWQHLDGWHALAYARTRHADDDYRRAARQQQVLMGIARAFLKPQNWPRIPSAASAFFQSVDTNLTLSDILAIGPPLFFDGATGAFQRMVIDRDFIQRSPEGYAIPDYVALGSWLDAYLR